MKRFIGLLKKDFTVAYRNYFFLIVLVVAGLLILTANFLIPEKANLDAKLLYAIETEDIQAVSSIEAIFGSSEAYHKHNDRQEVIAAMKKDKNSIGIILSSVEGKPAFEVIMQGYEGEKSRKSIELALESLIGTGAPNNNTKTVVLSDNVDYEKLPLNKSFIPLLLLNEPVMLGFIFLATLIFMEREEDTIKAYLITPGRLKEYLFSKVILMIALSLISTVLITVFTIGFNVNWLMLILISIAGSLFSSSMAMLLGSFFDSISKAMVWILGISLLMTAPMISYFSPSFSPDYITMIPTYDLMFAIREAIFPSSNNEIMLRSILVLTGISIVLYILSILSYQKRLVRE
ncbi:MAG: ABC transporter permease [Bacillota bacterium]